VRESESPLGWGIRSMYGRDITLASHWADQFSVPAATDESDVFEDDLARGGEGPGAAPI